MKKNDLIELRALELPALIERAKKLKVEISEHIIDKNMNGKKDLKATHKKKIDLAQVLTVMGQKNQILLFEKVSQEREEEAEKGADQTGK